MVINTSLGYLGPILWFGLVWFGRFGLGRVDGEEGGGISGPSLNEGGPHTAIWLMPPPLNSPDRNRGNTEAGESL